MIHRRRFIQIKEVPRSLIERHCQQVAVMDSVKGEIESRINQRVIALERWFSSEIFEKAALSSAAVEEYTEKLEQKRRSVATLKAMIETSRDYVQRRRQTLVEYRKSKLPSRSSIAKNLNFQLGTVISDLSKVSSELTSRRTSLLKQLRGELYPIEFHGKFRSIRGLAIPSLSSLKRYESRDEESVSTALGYLVHRTDLVSRIVDVPLKLVLVPAGSKSSIKDRFSVPSLVEYPLCMRANEKQRYLTAIQMLQDTLFHLTKFRGHKIDASTDLLETADLIIDREISPNS